MLPAILCGEIKEHSLLLTEEKKKRTETLLRSLDKDFEPPNSQTIKISAIFFFPSY